MDVTTKEIGRIYLALGQTTQALVYHEQAFQIATKEKFLREKAEILYNLGLAHDDLGDKKQAQQCYEQALYLYESTEDGFQSDRGKRQVLLKLAWVYNYQGDKEKAKQYNEQIMHFCREDGDRGREAESLQNLGWIYYSQGDIKQALECDKRALSIYKELKDHRGESWTLNCLGVFCDVFLEKTQYFKNALELFKEARDQRGEAWTLYNLAEAY